MTASSKCRGCDHAPHKGACRAKSPSRCTPLAGADGRTRGIACGVRLPCPCAWRDCACDAPVAVTRLLGTGATVIAVERGSAAAPDGTLAVRRLADGTLGSRLLRPGEEPGEGEWRGRGNEPQCPAVQATLEDAI